MTFDSFECAIHAMAPRCAHCQCHAIGHGVDLGGNLLLRSVRKEELNVLPVPHTEEKTIIKKDRD